MAQITRRHGREWALQMLVQADLNPESDLETALENFWRQQYLCAHENDPKPLPGDEVPVNPSAKPMADCVAPAKMRAFAEERVRGVLGARENIDAAIAAHAQNWDLYRLGTVERNVLRLAYWELTASDVPAPVVMNEAVDLAKYFSSAEAGRFVNGVLDKMREDIQKKKSEAQPGD